MKTIHLIRKRVEQGTVAENTLTFQVGGLNIGDARIPFEDCGNSASNPSIRLARGCSMTTGNDTKTASFQIKNTPKDSIPSPNGRWPANVIIEHAASCDVEVCECQIETWTDDIGTKKSGHMPGKYLGWGKHNIYGSSSKNRINHQTYGDEGLVTRFFKNVKKVV